MFPCRGKKPLTEHGFKDATTDEGRIREWADMWPDANVAIACGASNLTVLDIDHGFTEDAQVLLWLGQHKIEPTYIVRTGRRPEMGIQIYFAGVMPSVGLWKLDGCEGQVKSLGGYVMAAGSVHPDSGAEYTEKTANAPAALPEWVRALHTKREKADTGNPQVPKSRWDLPVYPGQDRTGFLLEQTGQLRNLGCGLEAIAARMRELNDDPSIIAEPIDEDRLLATAASCAKYPVPEPVGEVVISEPKQPEPAAIPERVRPAYPVEVWDGTAVGEFAKLCAHDNNVPRKMYAESFRCVLGAVIGDRLSSSTVENLVPRSYTVIVAPKGKGKGTAIRRAVRFFGQSFPGTRHTPGLAVQGITPGLLSGDRDFEWKPKGIGAWMAAASSVPGMARLTKDLESTIKNKPHLTWGSTLPRIISVHEEMKTFLSTLFIEGGVGSGMEGVVCQLWDDVSFHGTATGTRDALYGEMMFSLLAGVTEQDWFDLLSRGDAVGGGLMSRLNIIGTEGQYENVAKLKPIDFAPLQETFLPRVMQLEDAHVRIASTEAADRIISEWADNLPEGSERMNVHAWRSALLLAWLKHEGAISAKTAEDAVLLGQYQIASHEYYRTVPSDNAIAKVQTKILRVLEMKGPGLKRELQRHTHAYRDGTELWNRALAGLIQDGRVGKAEDGTYYLAAG